ncbi:polycystin family receptor for egg jelly-like [Elgaria multicarinata webbii]|uniref:polycystin family receptor for egg jelly-like n=1 Tax=Elgaria multicarinata webbii TaxID=159646 RepID=UPI002FCD51B9
MYCLVLLIFLLWYCSQHTIAVPLYFLPPPLFVFCSNPQHRVYQKHDNDLSFSCFWDGKIDLKYSRSPGLDSDIKREETGVEPPPHCQWYQDSILVKNTNLWSGQLVVDSSLDGGGPHPPWAFTRITMQCVSSLCHVPICAHKNLSIEISRQDVRLFLFSPLPIREWQPVQLGWCARLKSSTWSYHFKSQGGSPADLLIPSNQYSELPTSTVYPHAELHQVCASYYSYHMTVRYPHRGFYTASLHIENGPQLRRSLDLNVQPALLHVFSASSTLLRLPPKTLNLSWTLRPLSSGIMAYTLVDMQGLEEWPLSHHYNPFALQSDFCAEPKSRNSREKVVANIYFHTNDRISQKLTGKLDFSHESLIFRSSNATPIYLTLNPQKIRVGTYFFSHARGLYYFTQEGSFTNATGENSSAHYIFYQQQSLSYLIIIEFVQLQWYRFAMHLYLNRRETLFKSLGEKDIEVLVFDGHSPDEGLAYIVWFIPIQHPLLQCEWDFSLQLFDSRKQHLLWNNTYTYKDQVKPAARFLPHSALSFKPALYTGFVAEVNCRKSGLAHAVLKAKVSTFASKVMQPTVACQKSFCHELEAHIQKPNPSDPVRHYRRQSTITLEATAKAECRPSIVVDVLWKIYHLKTAGSIPDWANPLKLPDEINTCKIVFHIPGNVLFYGFHHVNFTMTVYIPTHRMTIRNTDSVVLQILESDLVAIIAGGMFRTVGTTDPWALDASASSDPDSTNPLEGVLFNWYCTKRELDYSIMKLSPGEKCHPHQVDILWTNSTNPVQVVEPNAFQENMTYYFILIILKQHRSAHAFQTVHVLPGSVPVLNVTCIENCGKVIKVTERFVLSGRCLNCEEIQTAYLWTLFSSNSKEIHFDWASKTTTGRSSPYMYINSFAFRDMTDKFYILSLKVSTQSRPPAVYRYSFYVNSAPQIGKCIIYPREGTAFHTKFVVQCSGFKDKNGPLTYKVIAHSDLTKMTKIASLRNNTFGTIVYVGHQQETPPSFLPTGTASKKYVLVIYVQVYDTYGAFSQVTLQATVHDPRRIKATDIVLNELYGLINELNGPMPIFVGTKDYLNIGFLTYMMASVLNNIKDSPTFHHSKIDLRKALLNVSAGIPITDVEMINQMVTSICQITQDVNEINGESQLLAVRKLREASEALKMHTGKDLGSKKTEILGNGIFTGLSNVLRASLLGHGDANANAIKEIISVTEILADLILQGKVPGEHDIKMEAQGWSIHLWKNEKWKVSRTFFKRRNCKNCFYPRLKQDNHTELPADAVVSTVHYVFHENPFTWVPNSADISTVVIGFKLLGTKANGDIMRITPEVTEVRMARKDKGSTTFNLTIGPNKKLSKTTGGFSIEIKRNSEDIFIQILCNMEVTFNVSIYLGLNVSYPPIASYIAFSDKPPIPHEIDFNIPDCAIKAPYILCLPQTLLRSPFQGNRAKKWNISVVLQSHPIVRGQTTKIVHIAVFTASCLDLDGIQNQWKEGTCALGPQTSWSKVHCICKGNAHSRMATSRQFPDTSIPDITFLGSKLRLYPNPLDLNKVLLAEFDTNPVTLVTVFSIFAVYIFCTSWAMLKDKADLKRRNKILVLPDNDPYHKVPYLVTIYTGSRLGSGTTADVFIELTGKNGASGVHHIKHPKFRTLFRASADTFLLTTKHDLGDIFSLHVWHNNGGSSPSWYLSRVKVQNVHTNESWLFLCRNWLGLNKADGKIERTFDTRNIKTHLNKMDYFLIKLAKDLEDNHIWLSVFASVVTGSFNRVQRVSCCLVIMLHNLLFNIMFFSGEEDKEVLSVQLRYLKSMYIGLVSALFSIPLHLTITILFRYSQEEPSVHNTDENGTKGTLVEDALVEVASSSSTISSNSETCIVEQQHMPLPKVNANGDTVADKDTGTDKKKKPLNYILAFLKRPRFAWWWRYVAWTLVFSLSAVSSCFIILYGLTYGYTTSSEWFIASMTSLFQSIFLLQTLKMVLISAMSTISQKYYKNITWISTEQYQEMQLVKVSSDAKDLREIHHELARHRCTKDYEPLKEDELIRLRKKARAQQLAFVFVRDIICHLIFSTCIFITACSTAPTTTFYYNKAIYNKFSLGLSKINKLEHIYMWMSNVFVPLMHNDYQPTYLSGSWSKILGLPRMRQIRAQNTEKICFHPDSIINNYVIGKSHCRHRYGTDPEDQSDYDGSWTIAAKKSDSHDLSSFQGFTYQSEIGQWQYKSYGILNTYGPGGYSFYFFPGEQQPNTTLRLYDLQKNNWLDEWTWAVIFELTMFNPDANLFCSMTVMFETTNVGVVNASLSVHSYKLSVLWYEDRIQMVLYGIVVFILIFYLVDEFCMLRQERIGYLKTAVNLNNFVMKITCIIFLLLIALKFKLAFTLLKFYLLNPEKFVPFHVVSQVDQLFRMVTGVLAFFLVLKLYRYFRFMYTVRLADRTLSASFPVFVCLTMIAVLFFSMYMSFGYLIFGEYELSYNTLIHSLQSVLSCCFFGLKGTDIITSNSWLGIFFLASLMCSLIFVFINLWRALIISIYMSTKQPVYELPSDEAEAINCLVLTIQSMWLSVTLQSPSASDSHCTNTVIYGTPVTRDDQQQRLKRASKW